MWFRLRDCVSLSRLHALFDRYEEASGALADDSPTKLTSCAEEGLVELYSGLGQPLVPSLELPFTAVEVM